MLITDDKKYIKTEFVNEAEIESVVEMYYQYFFGSSSIYLPKVRMQTQGNIATIPDALVIDVETEEWYIVEAERAVHGTWHHIAPQVSKQITSVSNRNTLELIQKHFLDYVRTNDEAKRIFDEYNIHQLDIGIKISSILKKLPKVAIPIDSIPKDLKEWAETLKTQVIIWTLQKYVDVTDDSNFIYKLPDDLTPTIETNPQTGRTITVYELQGAELILEIVNRGYVQVGDKLTMTYKPRSGGSQNKFEAEILTDGKLMVDGEAFSNCSYAAVHCYRKVGGVRETENGLRKWKLPNGKTLEAVRAEILSE